MKTDPVTEQKPDIFDKLMHLPGLRVFEPFYKKNKEVLMYLFFGVLTTAVSFITAGISKSMLEKAGASSGAVSVLSTTISWICAVTFAYITNRTWVFRSVIHGAKGIMVEALSFYGGRLFTYVAELGMMWLGYTVLEFNYWATKIVANVIVLILNYIISKLIVFMTKRR